MCVSTFSFSFVITDMVLPIVSSDEQRSVSALRNYVSSYCCAHGWRSDVFQNKQLLHANPCFIWGAVRFRLIYWDRQPCRNHCSFKFIDVAKATKLATWTTSIRPHHQRYKRISCSYIPVRVPSFLDRGQTVAKATRLATWTASLRPHQRYKQVCRSYTPARVPSFSDRGRTVARATKLAIWKTSIPPYQRYKRICRSYSITFQL